jgi:RecA/RadA recombinase
LDIHTGGGLPAGGLSQVDGPEGAGKNLLIYHYFAQAQKIYGDDTNLFMLCMEFPFDKMFARKIGFRVPFSDYEIGVEMRRRKEAGREPLTKEEIKELQDETGCGRFHVMRGCAEANLDAVVAMIESNAYQLGAIDSWDAMLTAWEDETDLSEDARMASASSVQTRWMRKVHGALTPRHYCPQCGSLTMEHKKTNSGSYNWYCRGGDCNWKGKLPKLDEIETTVIGVRQVRANMKKTQYGREWKIGGSWALKHGKLVDIQVRQTDIIKAGEVKIGKEIGWELVKGKAGTHEGPKGTFKYFFEPPSIDVDFDFYTYCTANNIIHRAGSSYTFGDTKFKGKAEVLDALADDPEFKKQLWQAMLEHANLQHVRYR